MGVYIDNESLKNSKQNYILAIAINVYKDKRIERLNNCCLDVNRFIKATTENFYFFNQANVKTIFNNMATKAYIMDSIRDAIFKKPNEADANLIIYFSCHGEYRSPKGYIVPYDADCNNVRTFISYNEIISLMKGAKLHHILIISDACQGGTIFKLNTKSIHIDPKAYIKASRWGLTSGGKETVLDGKKKQGSPFSTALIKTLTKKRSAETKSLTLRDVVGELRDELQELRQTPESLPLEVEDFNYKSGEFVFFPRDKKIYEDLQPPPPKRKEEFIPQPPFIQREEGRQIPERPSGFFGSLLFLLLAILAGITINHKTETRVQEPTIGGFMPAGLLDATARTIQDRRSLVETTFKPSTPPSYSNIPDREPFVNQPIKPTTRFVRFDKNGNVIYLDEQKLDVKKRINATKLVDSTNVVFVGSFNIKENADALLVNLKSIGYKNAEIIMKENMPYAVVVSGFYSNRKDAKSKLSELKKQGFEVYSANKYWREIYRDKELKSK